MGCHDCCHITNPIPVFGPTLSLILDTRVHLICPNVSRCLLSIPVHSCQTIVGCRLCYRSFASLPILRHSQLCTLLPVSAPLSFNLCPATVSFAYSSICLRRTTYFTKTTTYLHPLHANANTPPLVSAHVFSHRELPYCIKFQLLQLLYYYMVPFCDFLADELI